MALTQADLDALDRAIAAAELEVEQNGVRVRYASFADLKARREFVSGVLATGSGTRETGSFQYSFRTQRGE